MIACTDAPLPRPEMKNHGNVDGPSRGASGSRQCMQPVSTSDREAPRAMMDITAKNTDRSKLCPSSDSRWLARSLRCSDAVSYRQASIERVVDVDACARRQSRWHVTHSRHRGAVAGPSPLASGPDFQEGRDALRWFRVASRHGGVLVLNSLVVGHICAPPCFCRESNSGNSTNCQKVPECPKSARWKADQYTTGRRPEQSE